MFIVTSNGYFCAEFKSREFPIVHRELVELLPFMETEKEMFGLAYTRIGETHTKAVWRIRGRDASGRSWAGNLTRQIVKEHLGGTRGMRICLCLVRSYFIGDSDE